MVICICSNRLAENRVGVRISEVVGITVGNRVAPISPHRLQICTVMHPAPALGLDDKSLTWPRVTSGGFGPETFYETIY